MRYDSHDSVCNSFLQARPFMQDVIPNYTTFYMYIYIYIYIYITIMYYISENTLKYLKIFYSVIQNNIIQL